jgi:hypothetical protein
LLGDLDGGHPVAVLQDQIRGAEGAAGDQQ